MLNEIREEIKQLEEKIKNDPSIDNDTKEYFAYVKKRFSDVRLLKAAGYADIVGPIYFINEELTGNELSSHELTEKYKKLKAELEEKFVLIDKD